MRLVLLNMFLSCCAETIGYVFRNNNTWFYNIYIIINILSWIGVFYVLEQRHAKVVIATAIVYAMLWAGYVIKDGINVLANLPMVYGSAIILVFYFMLLLSIFRWYNGNIKQHPLLWICIATLLYYGCSMPMFILLNYVIRERFELGIHIYKINLFFSIIHSFLLAYSFYLARKPHNIQFLKQPYVRH